MGIGTLLGLLFVVAIISGLGRWATQQRFKRMYEEKYQDCCGENCCEHENKAENKKNDRDKDTY